MHRKNLYLYFLMDSIDHNNSVCTYHVRVLFGCEGWLENRLNGKMEFVTRSRRTLRNIKNNNEKRPRGILNFFQGCIGVKRELRDHDH